MIYEGQDIGAGGGFLLTAPKTNMISRSKIQNSVLKNKLLEESLLGSDSKSKNLKGSTLLEKVKRNALLSKLKGAAFAKAKRKPLLDSCSPGPKYQTRKPITDKTKIKMTIKNRYKDFLKMFENNADVPGPKYKVR